MIGKLEVVGLGKGENPCLVFKYTLELIVLELLSREVLGTVEGCLCLH